MKKALAIVLAFLFSPQAAGWADTVAGDSIGVGVAAASGLPNVATVSASITSPAVLTQLGRASGTVYLFLGTNNVAGNVPVAAVQRIATTARSKRLSLFWIGPPCMNRGRYGKYVRAFDASLGDAVRGAGANYISLYHRERCSLARSSDGVHFSGTGYRTVWNLVHEPIGQRR